MADIKTAAAARTADDVCPGRVPRPAGQDLREIVMRARALANMVSSIVAESGIGDGLDVNDYTGQTQQALALLDGVEHALAGVAQWCNDAEDEPAAHPEQMAPEVSYG